MAIRANRRGQGSTVWTLLALGLGVRYGLFAAWGGSRVDFSLVSTGLHRLLGLGWVEIEPEGRTGHLAAISREIVVL